MLRWKCGLFLLIFPTRAFSLLTHGFELVTRGFELKTSRFELVTCNL